MLKAPGDLLGLIGFQLHEEGEIEQYIIFENETSRRAYDPAFFEVEITYALGYEFWHKGYATEAGRALIEHGFRVLNIGRIVNSVAEENVHSVKLMKRLGLRIERSLKPKPFIGPWKNSDGVIGILDNPHWQRR